MFIVRSSYQSHRESSSRTRNAEHSASNSYPFYAHIGSLRLKVCIAGSQSLTATGRHLLYGITQCYLPPDPSERAPP